MTQRDDPAAGKRRPGRPKGSKPSAAQLAAGRANVAKGRQKRAEALSKADPEEAPGTRWSRLLDGTLTVKDLDDDEIQRMRVKGKGGLFNGRPKPIPSHLAQQFRQEAIRRAKEKINLATPKVTAALLKMADDPDVKDSDRIKILMYLMDRQLGKTPDVIHVEGESDFDAMLRKAVGLDRDLADGSTEDK